MSESTPATDLGRPEELRLPESTFAKFRLLSVVAIAIGAVLTGLAAHHSLADLQYSYLVAFVYWLTFALGGVFFVIIERLARSGWSVVVRRWAEAMGGSVWVFAILFVPVLMSMTTLFPWTTPKVAELAAIKPKLGYLNPTFFYIRAAFYFAMWIMISRRMLGGSLKQDHSGDVSWTKRLQAISPVSLLVMALTSTFAAFDWVMSLSPAWYSTIFGVYFFAGCILSLFASLSLLTIGMKKLPKFQGVVTPEHLHIVGKYLFAFTVFWSYIAFVQFFLIWYANIPEETIFYIRRFRGDWATVSWALVFCNFAIQFAILLPRTSKRIAAVLALGAAWVITFHYLDIFWLIMPNRDPEGARLTLGDIGTVILIGGIYAFVVLQQLKNEAILPFQDPRLSESLVIEN